MKNFEDLNRLTVLLTRHRMPKEHNIFLEIEPYLECMRFLKNLGSSGVLFETVPNSDPKLECATIHYSGFKFNIISY